VCLHAAVCLDQFVYIVQDLVVGMTLAEHLSLGGPLAESPLRAVAVRLLAGLSYLRRVCILHRDLKPSNLLLSHDGDLKIGDFGMAAILRSPDDHALTLCGSLFCMSPERFARKPHSFSCDVWSLGMLLYEAALGRFPGRPADAATGFSFWSIEGFLADDISIVLPDAYSRELIDFIAKCLHRNPAERWTVEQLEKHPWIAAGDTAAGHDEFQGWVAANRARRDERERARRARLADLISRTSPDS
jgi:mitogen-activated protein kinase kinase 1